MTVASSVYLTADEATDLLRAMAIAARAGDRDTDVTGPATLDAASCSKVVWGQAFRTDGDPLVKRFGPLATMLTEFVSAFQRFRWDDDEPEPPTGLYEKLGHVLDPTYDPGDEARRSVIEAAERRVGPLAAQPRAWVPIEEPGEQL